MFQPALSSAKTVLCLGAHSDDIEIGCGGVLLELIHQNPSVNIHWVVLSGDSSRAREARLSAEQFLAAGTGKHDIQLKEFRDSYFPTQWESIKDYFHELSRDIQPDLIFTHRRDDAHQDHRVVSELTWCAFRRHLVFEYEIPKYEGDLGQPNVFIPVEKERVRQKTDLLIECFGSQRQKYWFDAETFNAMLRLRGLEANSRSGYAEAFHCRKVCMTVTADTEGDAPATAIPEGVRHVHSH